MQLQHRECARSMRIEPHARELALSGGWRRARLRLQDRRPRFRRPGPFAVLALLVAEERGPQHVAAAAVEQKLGEVEPHAQVMRLVVQAHHRASHRPRRRGVEVGRILPPAIGEDPRELQLVVLDELDLARLEALQHLTLRDGRHFIGRGPAQPPVVRPLAQRRLELDRRQEGHIRELPGPRDGILRRAPRLERRGRLEDTRGLGKVLIV
mmetsp:Transcript_70060/g.156102  ORF Transcript_70060/g.156102 Transcript_70060/m.156102 type:complete len:210 (+) Transcript_70060:1060-1689(+)